LILDDLEATATGTAYAVAGGLSP